MKGRGISRGELEQVLRANEWCLNSHTSGGFNYSKDGVSVDVFGATACVDDSGVIWRSQIFLIKVTKKPSLKVKTASVTMEVLL